MPPYQDCFSCPVCGEPIVVPLGETRETYLCPFCRKIIQKKINFTYYIVNFSPPTRIRSSADPRLVIPKLDFPETGINSNSSPKR